MRPTIALAMIVKNEEFNLPILLKSVEGCFDKIYITDTGSTDNTVEVAKAHGCEVRHFDWVDDFAAARNASIAGIKEDYIAWLDGDDSLNNPEAFKVWRDNVMETGDYWLATYHYAHREDGSPACSFIRERAFRNNGKFQFKYFVHEGLIPLPGEPPKVSYVQAWSVKHRRTSEDLAKDRGRNLKLFDHHKEKLDPRMKFYYGKEFYDNGDAVSAAHWLGQALLEPTLENHDRMLATQYATYAFMQANQLDKAIGIALTGVQLYPHRAELWVAVGDCYLKQQKIQEALPFFSAAKNCVFQESGKGGVASPVFTQKEAYTFYPRNQVSRIYANMGKFEEAKKEVLECIALHPNEESETMLQEIDRVIQIRPGSKVTRKKVDDIVITGTPGSMYEWDMDVYRQKGIGGSETAAVEMASHLHKLSGRPVKVFNQRKSAKTCDGVEYIPLSEAPQYFGEVEPYFHIAWRHNYKLTDAPTYLWCHDMGTMGAEQGGYRKILALSPFHKAFLMSVQGIPEDKIRITRNGIDPLRFEGLSREKKPLVVFRSSPDRGLMRALLVMDEVRKELPLLEFNIYYGFDNMYKIGGGALADKLKREIHARPWVRLRGNVDQKTLSSECAQAMVWLYPTDFTETYCIGAIESLCEGVYPVVRSYGGLKDTLKDAAHAGMCSMLESDCVTPEEIALYAQEVVNAVREEKWTRMQVDPSTYSWESVAKEWLDWFKEEVSVAPSL